MTPRAYIMRFGGIVLSVATVVVIGASFSEEVWSQVARFAAHDPGVRHGSASAGAMLPGLTALEKRVFGVGLEAFEEVASVQGGIPTRKLASGRASTWTVAPAVIRSRL